jgi:hypothetical protein
VEHPDATPGVAPGVPLPPRHSHIVDWITRSTRRDRTIHSAIPPLFAGYCTIAVPEQDTAKERADAALVEVLQAQGPDQPWWLGFLDTGAADIVQASAPRISIYVGWPYVLMRGGPEQALNLRRGRDSTPWHSTLPELIFPDDRSWLVSTMWDDDWRCVGGPVALIRALRQRTELQARQVSSDEDATPPGHDY